MQGGEHSHKCCTCIYNFTTLFLVTTYRIARKFHGVKFSWKLIWQSFCNFIFKDSDPIAIINDINTVSQIKIFVGRDKFTKTVKILTRKTLHTVYQGSHYGLLYFTKNPQWTFAKVTNSTWLSSIVTGSQPNLEIVTQLREWLILSWAMVILVWICYARELAQTYTVDTDERHDFSVNLSSYLSCAQELGWCSNGYHRLW